MLTLPRPPHRVAIIHALDVDFFIVISVNVMRIIRFISRCRYLRRRCRSRRSPRCRRDKVPRRWRCDPDWPG
ncbi:hypothetical protein PUN28_014743 [Cardiocondyla obscurior]|uniref:Uncharacterized protein n=1 Tax=Cardiocondyla obscurior TaxID=286306 RepID=A0AAW2EWD0_9HYME